MTSGPSTPNYPLAYQANPGSLPAEYVLGPSEGIAVEAIRAKIDGTGASGSFYPCLSIYSQDGKLIARVPTSTAYAAGDTGEVTWSPFLRKTSASAPPPSGSFSACIAEAGGGNVLSGATLTANFSTGSVGSNDATFFPGLGSGNGVLVQQTDSTWYYWFSVELNHVVQAGVHRFAEVVLSGDNPPRPFKAQTRLELASNSGGTNAYDTSMYLQNGVSVTTTGSDYELTCIYRNDTAGTQTVNGFGFWATKLGSGFAF